jgi:hypothetical protein
VDGDELKCCLLVVCPRHALIHMFMKTTEYSNRNSEVVYVILILKQEIKDSETQEFTPIILAPLQAEIGKIAV